MNGRAWEGMPWSEGIRNIPRIWVRNYPIPPITAIRIFFNFSINLFCSCLSGAVYLVLLLFLVFIFVLWFSYSIQHRLIHFILFKLLYFIIIIIIFIQITCIMICLYMVCSMLCVFLFMFLHKCSANVFKCSAERIKKIICAWTC